jgi:RND superfamily putative drug exporter
MMDATVVRATLVPAVMRLAGDVNWWAPGFLRRFHDRYGIAESVPEPVVVDLSAHQRRPRPRPPARQQKRRERPLVAAGREKS